ncbi:TPA: NYN domain-containing protein [Serratia marcescens]|uniref:NYN domain-containing protein n=1 Tax=Serratia TaxID=613 RepID=UPI000B7856FF|nr:MULTISPECIES: NYN domain-containing protein [Serratia]MBH2881895.1 NYN domain-containing protein [Serratia ureilytica]MBM0400878.1 NYN domain-containing protein [Serratia sp. 4542]HAU5720295.1 NYN domain-containing protein [Serratia marcescens]HAU5740680.1 NYN domain-containing protein [Serratia marcescens]HAU5746232.1 NYN domain-containing protein [Serratia marcescens]
MTRSYAIMIDAGFLRAKLGTKDKPIDAEVIKSFVEKIKARVELDGLILHRVYYYDAEPLTGIQTHPISGEKIDFSETDVSKRNKIMLDELKRTAFFAVRLGETNFRGWKVDRWALKSEDQKTSKINSGNVKPNVQQKGVDMRIALDMSSMSLKKQAEVFALVTGDSDFVPIIKFARKEGRQIYLYTLGHGVKQTMYEHSDLLVPNQYDQL